MQQRSELVRRLSERDYEALESLTEMLGNNPSTAAKYAWQALLEGDVASHMDICMSLCDIALRGWGKERLELLIRNSWRKLESEARTKLSYAFIAPDLLSTQLLVELFRWSKNSAGDRHLLLAALAQSYRDRNALPLLKELAGQVGSHQDKNREMSLSKLLRDTPRL